MRPIRIGSASRIEIGYDGENGARDVVFDAAKWMDEMPGCTAAITAQRADGKEYIAPDVTQNEAERTITWTLTGAETMEGEGRAQLLWMDGERIAKQAIFTTVCHESLKSDATQIGVPEPVWAQQSLAAAQEARQSAEAAKASEIGAQNVLEETKSVRDAAKQEIDAKKEGALAGIENAKDVAIVSIEAGKNELAPPVIQEVTGMPIVATDSADRPLRGLTVYGKTTQDGTPSEDAPVDPVGTGTASPLRIVTAGRNLATLTPRTANNNGITSSYDAQTGVLTVTGTATGTAYVSYWMREPIPAGVHVDIGIGNGSIDGNITLRVQSASANTTIATLDSVNKVVNLKLRHAFEFLSIRVNAGATVNMKMQIGVTVRRTSAGYTWTHPDDPTSAQIIMPGLHTAVAGLLQGLPAIRDGNYTDENGKQWIADTVEYDAQAGTARIVKRVESVTYDGSEDEDWGVTYGYQALCISVANAARISHGLCTHFEGMDIKNDQTAIGFSAATDDGLIAFRPNDVAHMILDIGVWRARLAESPVTVLYALAEPVIMPITGDELAALTALRSRYPETTMYNDAGAKMAARYIADTKKYVDDADAEIAKAVIDVDERVDAANVTTSRLYGKTMYYDGDSIAYGAGSNGKGFGDLLAIKYNMVVDKFAVSGATLSVFESQKRHNICTSVKKNMKKAYDYMLFDGGYNDYGKSIPLGALSADGEVPFSAAPDETTICGALESIFQYVQKNYPKTKIYYLLTHKVYNYWTKGNQSRVYELIKTVCDRYSVEVIDVFGKSGFCTYYDEHKVFTNNGDMLHPTEEGYNTFYMPLIERTMN